MDDLISRQAAIDGKILIQRANGVEIYSDEAVLVEYLIRLPSAEPKKELILCKDCKHRPVEVGNYVEGPRCDDGFRDETCPFLCDDLYYSKIPEDDFYCAYGENKDGTV